MVFIITIAATAGTPPQADTVNDNGDMGSEILKLLPKIFIVISDTIPNNILKKALLKGFLFLLKPFIIANKRKADRQIPR